MTPVAMQVGCSVPVSLIGSAAGMGFSFVELRVSELVDCDTGAFHQIERAVARAGIPARTFNFFLPPDMRIIGPAPDDDRLRRYVALAAERASHLGGETFVLGSGGARRIPDGFPQDEAAAQFRAAVKIAADEADRFGLRVAIEGLNHTEANFLHTLSGAITYAEQIDHPRVGVVADSYHMHMESEPQRILLLAGAYLFHVQVCDAGRLPPGSHGLDLRGFFIYLNAIGYRGTVAIESAFAHFLDEGPAALASIQDSMRATGALTVDP